MRLNTDLSINARNDLANVLKIHLGDGKAYAALMRRYRDAVFFKTLKIVDNREDAMDITMETFARAFRKLDQYQSVNAFSTWLFTIAKNASIDFLRKKKRGYASAFNPPAGQEESLFKVKANISDPEEFLIKKQQSLQLKHLIDNLPFHYREPILLFYFEDLSYEDIAFRLGISQNTLKSQLFRGRALLNNKIKGFNRYDLMPY